MKRRFIIIIAVATGALLASSCGGDDDSEHAAADTTTAETEPPDTTTTSVPAPAGDPVGIIALGHSGLTAENSGAPAAENSWATGTNPEVNSIYLRMIEIRPETEGNVANAATGNAPAAALINQAKDALETVPNPALVVIQSLDADLTCDGDVAANAESYGNTISETLDFLTEHVPGTRILIVGQRGRPTIEFAEQTVALKPNLLGEMSGEGPCDFYNNAGELVPENFATLTSVIEAYEAAQAEACAAVPLCVTDEGALATFIDTPEKLSSDLNHPGPLGLAEMAELAWPAVAALLTEGGDS